MSVDEASAPGASANPRGRSLLCPELIGRASERDDLQRRLHALEAARGGVVTLVGEAGVGKSRLAREVADAARSLGLPVLSGRAVPLTSALPYRPLIEAFLAAFRSAPRPDAPELVGFGGHLARLVPHWVTDVESGSDESPVLLGEAMVRLLGLVAAGRGCVLILEDLHWADAETVAAVDYLGDALRTEPVLCICTTRPAGAAAEMLERLEHRDPGATITIGALAHRDVDRMVAACLASSTVSAELSQFVRTHSDGSPFLVEELLAGLVASGQLRYDGAGWTSTGMFVPTVPASLRDSVRQRLANLDGAARVVIGAAALLGRSFEWDLLPGIAEVDGRAVVDGLRAAVAEQLIEVDGTGFTFRHALTREVVLSELLPPERLDLARRAWPAVERANPGLPGPSCDLAAELAEAAGRPTVAAARLIESARRALAGGALASSEATARRAQALAVSDPPTALDAEEMLVHVLCAAGKPTEALAIGRDLVSRLAVANAPSHRRADLLVAMARAAVTAGDPSGAALDAAAARAALADEPNPSLSARIDAVAAHVALEQARLDDAAALARVAVESAAATGQPGVECEALEVLGRVARAVEPASGDAWFHRSADVAARHNLARWHLRAQHELALSSWVRGDVRPLRETRDLAASYGALVTTAVMDLSIADVMLSSFDREGCLAAATSCVAGSRRYGLATEPVAHLWLAGAHALAGDDAAMQHSIADALARDPDDPRILGDLYGRILPTRAFVADDLGALPGLLDTMMEHVRVAPPTTSVFPGRILWATLHVIADEDLGSAALGEFTDAVQRLRMPVFSHARNTIEAVHLGRRGDLEGATRLARTAYESLGELALGLGLLHSQRMLVALEARRAGWGDPVTWLREAEAFFAAGGYPNTARRCRTMLGQVGAPIPRPGRAAAEVPRSLRALGVTRREADVLRLVAAGMSNRDIGERLFLSPKTVERHLSNLFGKTDVRNRSQLAEVARTHGLVDG